MVQVVDFPYLKLLKYSVNILLLKESFELVKKLNEEYYRNFQKCPCGAVVLTKLKKHQPAFLERLNFLSLIAKAYPL